VIDLRTLTPHAADAELLHGLRGAGASLAPVTSLRLRTHATGNVTTFFARYQWSRADEVVRAFAARAASAPARLATICSLTTGSGSAAVQVFGQYLGTGTAATRAIAALLEPGARLSQRTHSYLDAQLIFAGCLGKTTAQCRPQSEGGTLARDAFVAGSAYLAQPIGSAAAKTLAALIEAQQAARGSGVLLFDAQGGAIDDATPGESAFVHRGMRCSVQILSYEGSSAAGIARARAFVAAARRALQPIGTGQAYQNYPDADLASWRTAYYGARYADLAALKHERDPAHLLHFPQAIGV
jgi:hypothetical protein